jgi:putative hydrolase of the HAD superfamily
LAAARQTSFSTVFFDFGDTLVEGRPAYLHRVTDLLNQFGFAHSYEAVVQAFNKADYQVYLDSRSGLMKEERQYLIGFLNHFGDDLGVDLDWSAILPEILRRYGEQSYERRLVDGAKETLDALKKKGYRLGVISNNDGTCRQKCESLGIAEYFEAIVDSALEGIRKPSPKIFRTALERMKVSADEAAHVGDMYGSDVLGARDAGITPVWYNPHKTKPFSDYQPEYIIERLKQVLDFL